MPEYLGCRAVTWKRHYFWQYTIVSMFFARIFQIWSGLDKLAGFGCDNPYLDLDYSGHHKNLIQ